jgi:hypothetical protein
MRSHQEREAREVSRVAAQLLHWIFNDLHVSAVDVTDSDLLREGRLCDVHVGDNQDHLNLRNGMQADSILSEDPVATAGKASE